MKTKLCTLMMIALLFLTGNALAQGYTGYVPLDPDPREAITFDGETVTWDSQTFVLDENTYFLDCRLDENQIAGNPYAFNDIRAALSALNDGSADKPMTLLIAPGVYWLRNFGTEGGTDSLHCTARAIHVDCEYLNFYGLNHEAKNVVVGLERFDQRSEYDGDPYFDMFIVEGDGLRCENLTIGSYETHALEYALDPDMSRDRILTDPELQQMLFCTGGDGIATNCCFEGRMSLNQFAEYYMDCRMLVGCRAEVGVCVNCMFELNDNELGAADLFGCEVNYDPIVMAKTKYNQLIELPTDVEYEQLFYIDRYIDDMYYPEEIGPRQYYYSISRHSMSWVEWKETRVCIGRMECHDKIFPVPSVVVSDEISTLSELQYTIYQGDCKEMGLEMTIVRGPYVDEGIQANYDRKVAELRESIDRAKIPALKKQHQKKLDKLLNETLPQEYDVIIPKEIKAGYDTLALDWYEIEPILEWERVHPGRRVILPQSNNYFNWYLKSEGEYVYDDQGNLQDDYLRDENGELVYYHEGERNLTMRLNLYNYFLFLYGVAPEAVCEYQKAMYESEYKINYIIDTNVSCGEKLKELGIDVYVTHWEIGMVPCVVNLSVDGQPFDVADMRLIRDPYAIPDDLLNAVRVQTSDGVIYNIPNLYGEDPFNVTELIRQAAIANGEDADAYLNIPLELPEY